MNQNEPIFLNNYTRDLEKPKTLVQSTTKEMTPKKPNEGLKKPDDAGWYVAVVRVNFETRIADSIRINLNRNHVWFDYWIPKVKVVYIDKRSNK